MARKRKQRVADTERATEAAVAVTPEALEQVAALPKPVRELFKKVLQRLTQWPHVSGCKPLRGELAGWYRLRISDYRVRFRVHGNQVIVDKVGHRKDVYED
jgi:mRNA interferase RelE/StbE